MAKKETEKKTTVKKTAAKPAVKKTAPAKAAPAKAAAPKKPAEKTHKFTLTAPGALRVGVAGSFNNWDAAAGEMKQDKSGVWSLAVKLKPGRHEYKFVVDGAWWADPANPRYVFNQHGTTNSLVEI